jgi:hypothetical protein
MAASVSSAPDRRVILVCRGCGRVALATPSARGKRVRVCGIPSRHPRLPRGVLGRRAVLRWRAAAEEGAPVMLRGRELQCKALDGLLAQMRAERP